MKYARTSDAAVTGQPAACLRLAMALLIAVMVPSVARGGMENCRIIDYPDHVEAMCTGTPGQERHVPEQQEIVKQTPLEQNPAVAATNAHLSRRYQRLQQIREMGSQRKMEAGRRDSPQSGSP